MTFHTATHTDLIPIAQLHAKSWQLHYRGILSEEYLTNVVEKERLEVWTKRFTNPTPNQYIITAKEGDKLCGFSCLFSQQHFKFGSLLDNLHVASNRKRQGIGRQLIQLSREWVSSKSPNEGMYLWVYESNKSAIDFYKNMGGTLVEMKAHRLEDGSGNFANALRFYWSPME